VFSANIIVKGESIGTTSGKDGRFVLEVKQTPPFIISVSHIGYKTQEISVPGDNSTPFDIALQPDLLEMETIIVTGIAHPASKLESSVAIGAAADFSLYIHQGIKKAVFS